MIIRQPAGTLMRPNDDAVPELGPCVQSVHACKLNAARTTASGRHPARPYVIPWTAARTPVQRRPILLGGQPRRYRGMSGLRRGRRPTRNVFRVPRMPFPKASPALERFTVLDLTRVRSGPTAVRQLADWGANVIKIETPAHLETGDPAGGPRNGPDFQNLHRNKRSMTLNLKEPGGVAVFRRMVETADVA